jgi:putative copper resistance protein D
LSLSHWDAAAIVVKTLAYAGTLGASGAVFFLFYNGALIAGTQRRTVRRLVWGLAVLAVAAGGAQLLVTAGSMGGNAAEMWDGSLLRLVWQAGAGRANLIRAGGLLLAAIGVRPQRPAWWALPGSLLAATSYAWTGHAHALTPNLLPVLLLGVHLLAVAFWLGALAPLEAVARAGDLSCTAAAAARFGAAAVVIVAVLIAAAATLLWLLLGGVGGLGDIWRSAYGRWIILKLAFVAGLLGVAAYNKLRLTPRLRAGDAGAGRSLRAAIRLEMLLGGLALAGTATLTTVAGPPALD